MFFQNRTLQSLLLVITAASIFTCLEQTPTGAPDSTTTPAETKNGTFKRIAHISIKAKDLNRSIEYYQKIGFSTVFRFTRGGAIAVRILRSHRETISKYSKIPLSNRSSITGLLTSALRLNQSTR